MRKQTRYQKARKVLSDLSIVPSSHLKPAVYTLLKQQGFIWDIRRHEWTRHPATEAASRERGDKGEGEMNYYYFYFKSVNSSEVIRTPSDKTATALFMSGRYVECTKEEYEIAVESNSTSDAQPQPAANRAPDGEVTYG